MVTLTKITPETDVPQEEATVKLTKLRAPRTAGDALKRQAGLTGRHILGGLMKTATGLSDAVEPYLDAVIPGEMEPLTGKVDPLLTRMGFPEPENALERVVGMGSEFMTSAGPFVKAGQASKALAPMAVEPKAQAIGGAAGGIASQTAAEMDAPEWMQLLAGIGGSVAPTLGADALRAGLRNPQQAKESLQTLSNAGVTPTVGDVSRSGVNATQHRLRQMTEGGALTDALDERALQLDQRITNVADNLGPNATTQELGTQLQESLVGANGWLEKSGTEASKLYDRVTRSFAGDTPIALDKTTARFNAPRATDAIPSATKRLGSEYIRLLGDDLADDIAEFSNKNGTWNDLPYDSVRELRTMVGKKIDSSILQADAPMAELKGLYGALSDDLRDGVVRSGNKQAIDAMETADAYWKSRMGHIEQVEKVVNKAGGPESIYNTLMSGTKNGATKLGEVYSLLDPAARDALTGSFVRRLGQATPGAQNASGDKFSIGSYLTNWNKISPEAKRVLMRDQPEVARATDAVAQVAEKFKSDMGKYQNVSKTAGQLGSTAKWASAALAAQQGSYGTAAFILASPFMAEAGGRLMLNQNFVTWLARNASAPIEALPKVANQLRDMADKTKDGELMEFANVLLQGGQEVEQ